MTEELRHHLPVVVIVSGIGMATGALLLMVVRDNASGMSYESFSLAIIVIPCVIMVICSLIIMVTAREIGRRLFVIVTGISLVTGLVSMVVTSIWLSDATLASQLIANSPEGTAIVPPTQSPLIIMRDIAAFVVAPTIGSIAGAWIGSRLHPVRVSNESASKRKGKGKRS